MSEFQRGEKVRLRIRPDETGMVVGESNWGGVYNVRLTGSLATLPFESVELMADADFNPHDGGDAKIIPITKNTPQGEKQHGTL